MPINLKTCNLFFNKDFDSESLKEFLEDKREKIQEIKNSRDVVVSKFGEELYEAFVKHYTKKQWDMYPEELDKSVLERLPIRYNNDDLYFNDKYQGIPTEGYTPIFKKMIDHENISIIYETDYKDSIDDYEYKVLIITSSIDEYFNYKFTKLKYRSMDFVFETHDIPRFQENSVINFPDPDVDYTRITEFKHLTGQKHPKTTIYKEKPKWEGIQMYPIPQEQTKEIYNKYYKEAKKLKNIYFLGRLGKYKYINMDVACKEALELSNVIIQNLSKN
jgi:UDP-galactopyranose mutase